MLQMILRIWGTAKQMIMTMLFINAELTPMHSVFGLPSSLSTVVDTL